MSSDRKATLFGVIALTLTWGIFTVLMVRKVYTGMNGEEFVWMVVFPIPAALLVMALQPMAVLLAVSFLMRRAAFKVSLLFVAACVQFVLPGWVAQIDLSDDGSSSPLALYWTGSIIFWLIATATHAYIVTQPQINENAEDQGFD